MIKQARVNDKTIMKASRGEIKKPARKRSTAKKTTSVRKTQKGTGRVAVIKVDTRVMKEARRLARGDMSRIQIKDEATVIVKNRH